MQKSWRPNRSHDGEYDTRKVHEDYMLNIIQIFLHYNPYNNKCNKL